MPTISVLMAGTAQSERGVDSLSQTCRENWQADDENFCGATGIFRLKLCQGFRNVNATIPVLC